jgi:hypothetical protein
MFLICWSLWHTVFDFDMFYAGRGGTGIRSQ